MKGTGFGFGIGIGIGTTSVSRRETPIRMESDKSLHTTTGHDCRGGTLLPRTQSHRKRHAALDIKVQYSRSRHLDMMASVGR